MINNGCHKYFAELKQRIASVFNQYPERNDVRSRFPWVTGYLGNPFSRVFFIGEIPSLTTVERATKDLGLCTEEMQWNVSKGDKLFREMLTKYGFKQGSADSIGGWHCYITDIIKAAEYAQEWQKKAISERNRIADLWLPVLQWELQISNPYLVVAMGQKVASLLLYFKKARGLEMSNFEIIDHYSYVALRPKGNLPPLHPTRVAEYEQQFKHLKGLLKKRP